MMRSNILVTYCCSTIALILFLFTVNFSNLPATTLAAKAKRSSDTKHGRSKSSSGRIRIETSHGPVLGVSDLQSGVQYWKNIPFAAAPVGDRRWKSPVEPESWTGDLDASQFGPQCPQSCGLPVGLCAEQTSEDCLSLNVYRPVWNETLPPLPVMVFLPGGRFEQGTANCKVYEGDYFVRRGKVILVTVNYRLGLLSFMVDTKRGINGNFGIQDQRMALQWVQKNIAQFGGDPNSVTLFGESAGAASVNVCINDIICLVCCCCEEVF